MENSIVWVLYTQEIRTFFASNWASLNKVFVSKNFLVIFVLLFIDSFQVANDFWVNLTNLHIDFEIRYNGRRMENSIAWVSYTQQIRTYLASNSKFGISLNNIFVSKIFCQFN